MPIWLTTLLSTLISSVLVPWLTSKGLNLDPGQSSALNGMAIGALAGLSTKLHAKLAPSSAASSVAKMAGATAAVQSSTASAVKASAVSNK